MGRDFDGPDFPDSHPFSLFEVSVMEHAHSEERKRLCIWLKSNGSEKNNAHVRTIGG